MRKQLVVVAMLVCSLFCIAASAQKGVTVSVNGNRIQSDVPAVLLNNSTMLPLRAVSNALGIQDSEIQWNNSSKSIEIRSEGKYIFLVIGGAGAIVGDDMVTLNTAPYLENGNTMVPVRFISEALGANVTWDGATQTVTITK